MGVLFTNNATSTLLSSVTSDATTIFVQVADAFEFPAPSAASDYFMVVLENRLVNPVVREIVKCTARVSNQLTVIRAQEGTTALGWAANVTVSHRLTAAVLANIAAATNQVNQLYLGAFSSAPTQTLEHTVLIPGNLYYDTVLMGLYQYSGTAWVSTAPTSSTIALGIYLGSFPVPPISMTNGSALVEGTLYYSTSIPGLQIYHLGAWQTITSTASTTSTAADTNVIDGNLTVDGDITATGTGHFTNIVVEDDTSTGTLHLAGKLVVDAGDVSGTGVSQNFPSGVTEYWGSGNTDGSGMATIFFLTPYATQCNNVQLTLQGNPVNATIRLGTVLKDRFSVFVEDTDNHGGVPSGFMWTAKGF